jgi:outer membrane protein assembly factor BamB
MMCCDLQGKPIWINKGFSYESVYGVGASPTMADGVLIVVSDVPEASGPSNIWVFECETGRLLWTQQWPASAGNSGVSRTPIVQLISGEKLVLVWGRDYLRAYYLFSGREAWSYSFASRGVDLVASMVADQTSLYLSDQTGTVALDRGKLGSKKDPVLWKNTKRGPNCASPVLANGLLFYVTDVGIAHCLDSQTGKLLWRERLRGNYFASLITDGERVYFMNSEGLTTVAACEPEFRKLAENDLTEKTFASPAPVNGELFIRTTETLYCVKAS